MTGMNAAAHWQNVYATRASTGLSWHQPHLDTSLKLIRRAEGRAVLDAGGGDSTLTDDLLAEGYGPLACVDLAAAALERVRSRLGPQAERVQFVVGDITRVPLPAAGFDIWHDRAVLHFLLDPEARGAYFRQLRHTLRPGGHVILAGFAPDGPTRCSGLETARRGAADLETELGHAFALRDSLRESHLTPAGLRQNFVYTLFQYLPGRQDG